MKHELALLLSTIGRVLSDCGASFQLFPSPLSFTYFSPFSIQVFPDSLPHLVAFDIPSELFYEDREVDEVDEVETFLRDVHAGKVPEQHSDRGINGTLSRFLGRIKISSPITLVFVGVSEL